MTLFKSISIQKITQNNIFVTFIIINFAIIFKLKFYMMKSYDHFIDALYKKYPKKTKLTESLMDLLCLEREAVYRRLRKEVIFTVKEMVKIATTWNISLDATLGIFSDNIPFGLHLWNYNKPSSKELEDMGFIVKWLESIKSYPDFEYMEVSNKFSRTLISGFPYLHKLSFLKWIYQYSNEETVPFVNITLNEKIQDYALKLFNAYKKLPVVNFIWDNMFFYNAICNIRYFHSIYLITDEEKDLIKKELYALLDYISAIALKGSWPETKNKVNIYISHLNIDTNYIYYYYDGEVRMSCVNVFEKNEIYSQNFIMGEKLKNWMQLKKKASIQISEADEKNRIDFFTKQRKFIDEL